MSSIRLVQLDTESNVSRLAGFMLETSNSFTTAQGAQTECSPIFRLVFLSCHARLTRQTHIQSQACSVGYRTCFIHTFRLCVDSLGSAWYVALPALNTLTCPTFRRVQIIVQTVRLAHTGVFQHTLVSVKSHMCHARLSSPKSRIFSHACSVGYRTCILQSDKPVQS
jgi:hypothetical protein